ncbi:MAG: YqgE/AlgH family protein [Acidimicrobiia bacterium]|nr:YqgE/AlgH family protein [Acidimicrobiia bacterium]
MSSPDEPTAGMFLVATPLVGGPPFDRSVVLMLEHDEDGAIGIVLNLRTDIPVADHIPEVADRASSPGLIHIGGPVDTDTAIVLARSMTADFIRPAHLGDIGIVDPTTAPDDLQDLRVYAGYAGWEPGQLEAELAEGAWWVVPADRGVIFTDDTETVWERMVAQAPGTIPFHSTYTQRPSTN